jgi:hypothetical protein
MKEDVGYNNVPKAAPPISRDGFEAFLAEFNRQGGNIDKLEEAWNKHLEQPKQADGSANCCGQHKMKFVGYKAKDGLAIKRDPLEPKDIIAESEKLLAEGKEVMERVERLSVSSISSPTSRAHAESRLKEAKAVSVAKRKYAEMPFGGSINELTAGSRFKFDKDRRLHNTNYQHKGM